MFTRSSTLFQTSARVSILKTCKDISAFLVNKVPDEQMSIKLEVELDVNCLILAAMKTCRNLLFQN